jgi:hypothetical protein
MPKYQLVMRTGPTPGKVFELSGDSLTLGREPGNEVAINDAEISRKHAHLSFQGGTYVLEDLGSTNGTFVNGQRLMGPHSLRPGEIISFGEQISCTYEVISEPAQDPNATIISSKGMGMAAAPPPPPPTAPAAQPMQPPPQPRPVQPVSQPRPAAAPPPPSQPRPAAAPAAYAGKVPAGPKPDDVKPAKASSSRTIGIVVGVVVLCIVCGCVAFFVTVDQYQGGVLWCRLFPSLVSAMGGICP